MPVLFSQQSCYDHLSQQAPRPLRSSSQVSLMLDPYLIFQQTQRQRVSDGKTRPLLENCETASHILLLIFPQLGDFDSLEFAWWIQRETEALSARGIAIRVVGIGNLASGKRFCRYTGLAQDWLFVDPTATLHRQLDLYRGLDFHPPGLSASQKAWLNLLLMCAGIGSPGTLAEVFRGYLGDPQAPQLIGDEEMVRGALFGAFKGSWFRLAGGKGFQRPFELATLRLQNLVEVLTHWNIYVPNGAYLTQRGGTFLFDAQGTLHYEHRAPGILGFAQNMSRPFSFLSEIRTLQQER